MSANGRPNIAQKINSRHKRRYDPHHALTKRYVDEMLVGVTPYDILAGMLEEFARIQFSSNIQWTRRSNKEKHKKSFIQQMTDSLIETKQEIGERRENRNSRESCHSFTVSIPHIRYLRRWRRLTSCVLLKLSASCQLNRPSRSCEALLLSDR